MGALRQGVEGEGVGVLLLLLHTESGAQPAQRAFEVDGRAALLLQGGLSGVAAALHVFVPKGRALLLLLFPQSSGVVAVLRDRARMS